MDARFEKLNSFLEEIKTIGFWQRIFGWRKIRKLSYDASEEFKKLLECLEGSQKEKEHYKNTNQILVNDKQHLEKRTSDQEKEIAVGKEKLNQLSGELSTLKQENTVYKQTEIDRKAKYENDVAALNAIREQIQNDRRKEQDGLLRKEAERFAAMKKTWAEHQEKVKNTIKMICENRTIEYVEKVPFRGTPDNTIRICDEFVIFDAKSPLSDDLSNFPTYIKSQSESVKKYIKEENVRKDIFLVIPANTVDVIEKFTYSMGDYTVYVVTLDVLEPLILSLKKIESYEFVEQLTLEERENICAVIGKFAHMTKRRIQIDQFFAMEFLSILTKCGADLPDDILARVVEFEREQKLNPPQDRFGKHISEAELKSTASKIKKEAEAKGIAFSPSVQKGLRELPLYEDEKSDSVDS